MVDKNITFVGVGHIAQALIQGILQAKVIAGDKLFLANPHLDKLEKYKKEYGVKLTTDNITAAKWADILIISVRPKIVKTVIGEIKDYLKKDSLVIVVAACVTFTLLEKYFQNDKVKVIRLMPNIPVAYGLGVVGWIGNNKINKEDTKLIKELLSPLGIVLKCKSEDQLDKLSLISGCGPGYVGYFINNLEKIAKDYGFSQEESRKIVEATFLGTLHHLKKSKLSSGELVSSVATKGGITEEVIRNLDAYKFPEVFLRSIKRGMARINKLNIELKNAS